MNTHFCIALIAFTLAGCGLENPYEKHEKKCKVNCTKDGDNQPDSPRNHPRNTATQPTDAAYWLNVFEQSNVSPEIDESTASDPAFMSIVKSNPFMATKAITGISSLMSKFRTDIKAAKQMNLSANPNSSEEMRSCIQKAFAAPWVPNQGTSVDFGKCIPLNNEMFTEGAQTSSGGIIAYTEYEKVISFKSKSDWPQLASVGDLLNILPFATPVAGSLSDNLALEFNLNSLVLQSAKEIRQKKIVAGVREWKFTSLGESIDKPFKLAFDALLHRITINGDFITLQQSAYNPPSDTVFTGQAVEGNKIQISFDNFTITGSDVLPDTQLGFRSTAALGGSYLVAVNYAKSKPKYRNFFIQVKGKGIACLVDAYIVMFDANNTPVASDTPFQIDLCAQEG